MRFHQAAEGVARGGQGQAKFAQRFAQRGGDEVGALGLAEIVLQVRAGGLLQRAQATESGFELQGGAAAVDAGLQGSEAKRAQHIVDTGDRTAHALDRLHGGLTVNGQRLQRIGVALDQFVAVAGQRLADGRLVFLGVVGKLNAHRLRDLRQLVNRQAQRGAVVLGLVEDGGRGSVEEPVDLARQLGGLRVAPAGSEPSALFQHVGKLVAREVAPGQRAADAGSGDARRGAAENARSDGAAAQHLGQAVAHAQAAEQVADVGLGAAGRADAGAVLVDGIARLRAPEACVVILVAEVRRRRGQRGPPSCRGRPGGCP